MAQNLSSQPIRWIVVYSTYSVPEAHIVAGRLQSEGIPAMVHQHVGASALGIHIGSLGEITVLVREADYPTAMMILDPDEPDALPDSTDDVIYWLPDESEDEGE